MGFRPKPTGSTLSKTLNLVQTLLGLSRFGGPLENKIVDKRSWDDSAHGLRSELRSPGAKRPGRRDIFPSQSRIFIQKLDVLGPLLLKNCSEVKLQASRKMMFSPPRRKHLELCLKNSCFAGKKADDALPAPSFSKDWCRAPRCSMPVGDAHLW